MSIYNGIIVIVRIGVGNVSIYMTYILYICTKHCHHLVSIIPQVNNSNQNENSGYICFRDGSHSDTQIVSEEMQIGNLLKDVGCIWSSLQHQGHYKDNNDLVSINQSLQTNKDKHVDQRKDLPN